ncbi:hypothetical protein [Aquabacterium sp.]|uniref:hypothetical protein n=1 Tax=Aquabacterium sp. TaxID=1872578 RepID=UPI0035B42F72
MNPNRPLLKTLLRLTLALGGVVFAALGLIDQGLRTAAAPQGIVSFELCAYGSRCGAILHAWSPHARDLALLSLGIDYLFMLLYPGAICLALLLARARTPGRARAVTGMLAGLIWLAALADATENFSLIQMTLAADVRVWAWPATVAATVKFAVFGVALAWLAAVYWRYPAPNHALDAA